MATYTINKITLPNGDVCNLSGGGGTATDVQINGTSITSGGVANIPYASTTAAGVVSTGAQTIPGEKTFVATNGYGGSIIIDSNRIESGGQLTLKHRHADDEDPSIIGDTEVYTFKSNGDWGLEIGCYDVPSSGSGSGGTYTLGIPSGDYYLAYKNTTTSSSTTPVYFSLSDGALTACSGVVVTTGAQTFSGKKTFSNFVEVGSDTANTEQLVRVRTNSGTISLDNMGNADGNGSRGIWVGAHGTATSGKWMIRADTNNNVFIADDTTCDGVFKVTGGLQTINTTGNSASAPVFIFSNAPTANAEYGRIFLSYSNYGGRFKFRQYSGSSSARSSYNETYLLPQCDTSRSSSDEYDILTTKGTKTVTASLTTAGWSSLTQSVTVTGMTASAIVIVTADSASTDMYRHCGVYCSAQAANSLTFKCASVPTAVLTVNILTIG